MSKGFPQSTKNPPKAAPTAPKQGPKMMPGMGKMPGGKKQC